jgi:hypothetical protein
VEAKLLPCPACAEPLQRLSGIDAQSDRSIRTPIVLSIPATPRTIVSLGMVAIPQGLPHPGRFPLSFVKTPQMGDAFLVRKT